MTWIKSRGGNQNAKKNGIKDIAIQFPGYYYICHGCDDFADIAIGIGIG
jgi:hypothetical protein